MIIEALRYSKRQNATLRSCPVPSHRPAPMASPTAPRSAAPRLLRAWARESGPFPAICNNARSRAYPNAATLLRTLRHSLMRHQLACRCAGNIRPRSCSGFMSQKRFFAGHKVAWRLSRLVEQRAICAGARFQYPHYTRARHRFGLRYRQGSSATKPEQNPSRLFP